MDAEGLGRKLLLTPTGDPRRTLKSRLWVLCGYCDSISQHTNPASTFELSQCWHCKERLLEPRKGFWVTSGSLPLRFRRARAGHKNPPRPEIRKNYEKKLPNPPPWVGPRKYEKITEKIQKWPQNDHFCIFFGNFFVFSGPNPALSLKITYFGI